MRIPLVLVLSCIAIPTRAFADAGIPMLALTWPMQWLAIIPVILIESAVVARSLDVPFRAQVWPLAKANFLSTLIGVPIAWLAMLAVEAGTAGIAFGLLPNRITDSPTIRYALFPLMTAWIGGSSPLEFQVAFLILSLPFCAVSIFIEYRVLRSTVRVEKAPVLYRAIKRANILSYLLLCLTVVVGMVFTQRS